MVRCSVVGCQRKHAFKYISLCMDCGLVSASTVGTKKAKVQAFSLTASSGTIEAYKMKPSQYPKGVPSCMHCEGRPGVYRINVCSDHSGLRALQGLHLCQKRASGKCEFEPGRKKRAVLMDMKDGKVKACKNHRTHISEDARAARCPEEVGCSTAWVIRVAPSDFVAVGSVDVLRIPTKAMSAPIKAGDLVVDRNVEASRIVKQHAELFCDCYVFFLMGEKQGWVQARALHDPKTLELVCLEVFQPCGKTAGFRTSDLARYACKDHRQLLEEYAAMAAKCWGVPVEVQPRDAWGTSSLRPSWVDEIESSMAPFRLKAKAAGRGVTVFLRF